MVVRFVAHGDFLRLNFPSELLVRKANGPRSQVRLLLPEDPGYVVEEPNHAGGQGRPVEFVNVLLNISRLLVPLGGGLGEPLLRGLLVLWGALPQNGFNPIPGTQPYPGEIPDGCQFAPRCPHCQERCRSGRPVPYVPQAGGMVRCYVPEGGDTP